ncbi:MAG: hypothetical protein JO022_10045 [Acidobacteriaceae bacterium]|nr:hypothetical protein [Acidobacteriaceae bacterium]
MRTLRVCLVLLIAQSGAWAADAALLGLVMPDAKAIAGVQVAQAKASPFGQYVLTHMQPDDASFTQFMTQTGFDPRRDLTEIVMASNATTDLTEHFLVVARGSFDLAKITAAAKQNGGRLDTFMGVTIVSTGTPATNDANTVVGFPDQTTAIMGDIDNVHATIQRFLDKSIPSFSATAFLSKVQTLSAANDFWFLTLVPVSEFAALMPDPNLGQAMNGKLFQAINQVSGGMKFGDNVQVRMQAICRSEKDAAALADVVRFIVGLIQSNKPPNGTAPGQVSTLLDNLNLSTTGSTTNIALTVPEATLEQIFDTAKTQPQTVRTKRPGAPVQ